jgi:hypothetical protein
MSVKITIKTDGIKKISKELTSPRVNMKVGELIVEQMKQSIAAGLSPVRGLRRFASYKDTEVYPGGVKPNRPVNLFLSGEMLAALLPKLKGSRLYVGIQDAKQAEIAKAHQTGTKHMVARRFMPTADGEEFTVTITRAIRNLYAKILSDIIKRSK